MLIDSGEIVFVDEPAAVCADRRNDHAGIPFGRSWFIDVWRCQGSFHRRRLPVPRAQVVWAILPNKLGRSATWPAWALVRHLVTRAHSCLSAAS